MRASIKMRARQHKKNMIEEQIKDEILAEVDKQLESMDKVDKEMLNEYGLKKSFIMKAAYRFLFNVILSKMKIRLVITWNDKLFIDYEFPKS